MREQNKMSGFQKCLLACAMGAGNGMIIAYESLSKEEKKELHKQTARRMLDKALLGKLKEPYDEYEITYIKENLGIE